MEDVAIAHVQNLSAERRSCISDYTSEESHTAITSYRHDVRRLQDWPHEHDEAASRFVQGPKGKVLPAKSGMKVQLQQELLRS